MRTVTAWLPLSSDQVGEQLKKTLHSLPSDVWKGIGNVPLYTDADIGPHPGETRKAAASSRLRALQQTKPGREPGCFLRADQPAAIDLLSGMGVHDPPTQRAQYKFPARCSFTHGLGGPGKRNAKPVLSHPDCSRARAESPPRSAPAGGAAYLHRARIGVNTRHPTQVEISFAGVSGEPEPEYHANLHMCAGSSVRGRRLADLIVDASLAKSEEEAEIPWRHPRSRSRGSRPSSRAASLQSLDWKELKNRHRQMAGLQYMDGDDAAASPLLVQGSRPGSALTSVVDNKVREDDSSVCECSVASLMFE